jgi:hypothetical protein
MSDMVQREITGVRGQVSWFLALTAVFSTPCWILLAKHNGNWPLVLGLMCSPGAAALLTALLCRVPRFDRDRHVPSKKQKKLHQLLNEKPGESTAEQRRDLGLIVSEIRVSPFPTLAMC